jgi:hypothetical protein
MKIKMGFGFSVSVAHACFGANNCVLLRIEKLRATNYLTPPLVQRNLSNVFISVSPHAGYST